MRKGYKVEERGDPPGDVACKGNLIRFFWGKRLLRGTIVEVRSATVVAETKSGRSYGVSRASINEIERMAEILPPSPYQGAEVTR